MAPTRDPGSETRKRAQLTATFAVCRAILKERQSAHARGYRRVVQLVQQRQQLLNDVVVAPEKALDFGGLTHVDASVLGVLGIPPHV